MHQYVLAMTTTDCHNRGLQYVQGRVKGEGGPQLQKPQWKFSPGRKNLKIITVTSGGRKPAWEPLFKYSCQGRVNPLKEFTIHLKDIWSSASQEVRISTHESSCSVRKFGAKGAFQVLEKALDECIDYNEVFEQQKTVCIHSWLQCR